MTESWVMPSSAPADERRRDEHAVACRRRCSRRCTRDTKPVRVQHDRLVVAGLQRLDLGQRRVDVVAGGLRPPAASCCGRGASTTRSSCARPWSTRVVAEVGAPRPAGDRDVDRARQRVEAHLAVAVVRDRPDVAATAGRSTRTVSLVASTSSSTVYGMSIIMICARVEQPLDVVGEAEHRRALRRSRRRGCPRTRPMP